MDPLMGLLWRLTYGMQARPALVNVRFGDIIVKEDYEPDIALIPQELGLEVTALTI